MGELKKLYEERNMAELVTRCREILDAGSAEFEVYMYMACAQAARNNLSRLFLEEAMQMFDKAAELAKDNADFSAELFDNFVKEVYKSLEKSDAMFGEIAMTADSVQAYRDCMRLGADALLKAADFADRLQIIDTLEAKKRAVSCMVKLCAVYHFEQDLGKVKVKKVGNAPDDIREAYNAKYDEAVVLIRGKDASYVPVNILFLLLVAGYIFWTFSENSSRCTLMKHGILCMYIML